MATQTVMHVTIKATINVNLLDPPSLTTAQQAVADAVKALKDRTNLPVTKTYRVAEMKIQEAATPATPKPEPPTATARQNVEDARSQREPKVVLPGGVGKSG